jgi:predicted CoA-binding protein
MPTGEPDDDRARADDRALERARAREILDLQESRGPVPLLADEAAIELLRSARVIAVVGASSRPFRPSFGVFEYLLRQGYELIPVNPFETSVHGVAAVATLAEAAAVASGPIDLVDVFRRPSAAPGVAEEAVAVRAKAIWLQLGVISWEAARIAAAGGLGVVMDRCTAVEHRRL